MTPTRCAVIGVGYLGKFHAQKYAAFSHADLVAVADTDAEAVARVAADCGCRGVTDYRELLGEVDAVSIAVPTTLHYQVARDFLERGTHVLVEKPITSTVEEAAELNRIAREHDAILQVGHLERFNAALLDLADQRCPPLFIESHRLAPFKPRATDVNVVLDLMIHDIDIILDMVRSPVKSVAASGAKVLSEALDIANARIEFENGCVANVTSSRVSLKSERKMRIFQKNAYVSVDFQNRGLSIHRLGEREMFPGIPEVTTETSIFEEGDALKTEIAAFLEAVRNGGPVIVSGEDGQRALETAIRITEQVRHGAHVLGEDC
ncbi:Gfo/Idh/MocA family protein [Ectothiorhodospira sp. BSL-9]|uniref:Gfo/Idh/MocA family protein n=1 Tax=Ectothiorhodospira sp. BSL-9 TaxID=1442136 RepID=UPI0007B42685|nr:Gfo/Idh/MocA family oxidoreductase [Ectothiorhodospira sp. BSL-9]ANB02926.1 UDP-N-acetyl-D-glucosamine dehydrogenase [Ectothiorhodospira sp. BSL-9]TVQ74478.1 MAG: gfo/Idh/MocA family oxidoreductase [Chromatiaceae bacterium]